MCITMSYHHGDKLMTDTQRARAVFLLDNWNEVACRECRCSSVANRRSKPKDI